MVLRPGWKSIFLSRSVEWKNTSGSHKLWTKTEFDEYLGTIISFSHFLPRVELPYPKHEKQILKAIGNENVDLQLRSLDQLPAVHVFGRTRIHCDHELDGVRYVQHSLGFQHEHEARKALMLVFDGSELVCRQHVSY